MNSKGCDYCRNEVLPANFNFCPVCGAQRSSSLEIETESVNDILSLRFWDFDGEPYDTEIEDVTIEAQIDQVTEECCELGQACMKLKRALGNGNPTTITPEEAYDKVIEEFSDVVVAGDSLMHKLDSFVPYDIRETILATAKSKIKRKIRRLADAKERV